MYKKRDIHHLIENVDKNWTYTLYNNQFLGSGCARNVYKLDDNYVVKISRDKIVDYVTDEGSSYAGGVHQSLREIEVFNSTPLGLRYLINPIVEKGIYNGHVYIVQEYAEVDGDLDDYCTYAERARNLGYDEDEIYDMINDVYEMCEYFDLNTDDILEFSANVGYHSQRGLVIIDYGYPS